MQKSFRPRNIINKQVAGIRGVAKMTDKARAAHAGNIGKYKYGADSQQDTRILSFLGISADAFQEAAVRITNENQFGAWVLENCNKSDEEIAEFNRQLLAWVRKHTPINYFSKRHREILKNEERENSIWSWIAIFLVLLEC